MVAVYFAAYAALQFKGRTPTPVDERLRVTGLVPRCESARRAVRLVRKAVVSLSADGAEADFVLHATALVDLSLPDLVVAVRFAAGAIALHVPAAVQTTQTEGSRLSRETPLPGT